jgi:hypothetical protein
MRKPRVKLWMLMAAVATVALATGLELMRRTREYRLRRAEECARRAKTCEDVIMQGARIMNSMFPEDRITFPPGWRIDRGGPRGMGGPQVDQAVYYRRLESKYRRGASQPWRLIEPDPPVPVDLVHPYPPVKTIMLKKSL